MGLRTRSIPWVDTSSVINTLKAADSSAQTFGVTSAQTPDPHPPSDFVITSVV